MSRTIRRVAALAFAIAISAALLVLAPGEPAAAQGQTAPASVRGAFEVTPLAGGGWIVHDTRSGAMERWTPQPRGFEVHEVGFGVRTGRVRTVYTMY